MRKIPYIMICNTVYNIILERNNIQHNIGYDNYVYMYKSCLQIMRHKCPNVPKFCSVQHNKVCKESALVTLLWGWRKYIFIVSLFLSSFKNPFQILSLICTLQRDFHVTSSFIYPL